MQCLEVSGAVRPIYGSLGVKRLNINLHLISHEEFYTIININLHLISHEEFYMILNINLYLISHEELRSHFLTLQYSIQVIVFIRSTC